jgi:UDP-glucose 4-epimerase
MYAGAKILVTGGAGYIGSHICLTLLQAGYEVLVLDNLCNSSAESLRRVQDLGCRPLLFVQGDVRDPQILNNIFASHRISAVMHFAGLKAVRESVEKPLDYYSTNVGGTVALCQAMQNAEVFTLVFSSSATVYGDPACLPVTENHPVGNTTNPYGRSKCMVEQVLQDSSSASPQWRIALLRYFNPVGAHESGQIGEDPKGIPNNLLPYICQVAAGRLKYLQVFGNDYPTPDGTGVRDYIHVMDLAEGHLAALKVLEAKSGAGFHSWNLGTGVGYSVLDIVRAFEVASGRPVPYKIMPRRLGDIARNYADPTRARIELGWVAKRNLPSMMRDSWRWQSMNPAGFEKSALRDPRSAF